MMSKPVDVPPFDTQQAATDLRATGGFDHEQADAIVRTSARAVVSLVTTTDLTAAVAQLDATMKQHTADLRVEMKNLQAEMHRTINAQTWRYVATIGVMLGLLRWLFPTS